MLLLFMAKFEAKEHLKKLDQHATLHCKSLIRTTVVREFKVQNHLQNFFEGGYENPKQQKGRDNWQLVAIIHLLQKLSQNHIPQSSSKC